MSTWDATAFRDHDRQDGKNDVLFNGPGDGSAHGHVVTNSDGGYDYVRDVEGNVYIDNR